MGELRLGGRDVGQYLQAEHCMLLKLRVWKGHRGSTSRLHLALSKRVVWSSIAVPATKLILGQGCRAKFDQWITVCEIRISR